MDYCKITTEAKAQRMPNPYKVAVANPDEAAKATLAGLFGWLPMQYTAQPEYDPDTQYLEESWVEEDGKAVQVWTIVDKPEPEQSLQERVESLEENVSDLVNGVTE